MSTSAASQQISERRPLFFVSAGDPSGDAHAARLVEALAKRFPNARFVGYAGPKTAATVCDVRTDLTRFAVMWIGRAVANLPTYLRLIADAGKFFRAERPDAVILVDFPGFNWKIASKAKAAGVPVVYFMPPQIWGWGQWRVRKMRRLVDLILSCFSFENAWFRSNGCRSILVGHPFFEETRERPVDADFLASLRSTESGRSKSVSPKVANESANRNPVDASNEIASTAVSADFQSSQIRYLTLLPGSRDQEASGNLGDLLTTAQKVVAAVPDVRPVVAAFREEHAEAIRREIARRGLDYPVYVGRTPELTRAATCCLAVSGSVSIELLSLCKPTVIRYRVGRPQFWALRFLKRVKYITLTNLLAVEREPGGTPFYPKGEIAKQTAPTEKERASMVFPEFISPNDDSDEMARILVGWFTDDASRAATIAALESLRRATDFVESPISESARRIEEFLANPKAFDKIDSAEN